MIAVVASTPGCALFWTPTTPAEQIAAALEGQTVDEWIGRLDASLQPVADKEDARSAQARMQIRFGGINDSELCFSYIFDEQYFPLHDTVDEVVAGHENAMRSSVTFVFEARDSLEVDPDATWPAHDENAVTSVTSLYANVTTEVHTRDDGSTWKSHTLKNEIQACGPAPVVTDATKFITITRFFSSNERPPALYIWEIDR